MEVNYLCHYGIKGQRWGIRRFQYKDGSLTPAGRKRYGSFQNGNKIAYLMSSNMKNIVNNVKTKVTGKQYVDAYLKKGTVFSRIQTSAVFEPHAFYATYKKSDSNKYLGLFGKNLKSRANKEAEIAEKEAKITNNEDTIQKAKALRSKADSMKVYQLKIKATHKLKIPSDENAGDITAKLLKEKDFRNNLEASIQDSKEKMRRPTQQILFNQAQKALSGNINKLSSSEKISIYKAFNLSLTNHNSQEIAAQARFYNELKKKGYNSLLDYNDKEYSSYHAKKPMIVFDLDSVKLQSISETNPRVVDTFYKKYNAERIAKESVANTLGLVNKIGSRTVSECSSYIKRKVDNYLN